MTPGEQLFNRLSQVREKDGVITRGRWIFEVNSFMEEQKVAKKRAPRAGKVDRPHNPLFDCLAFSTGTRDIKLLTRNAARTIGVALADIREVEPTLTTSEIERVVAAYRQRHPTWPCTATAIAKHWGEFSKDKSGRTSSGRRDAYQEPPDWKTSDAARERLNASEETWAIIVERGWFDLGVDIRTDILRAL